MVLARILVDGYSLLHGWNALAPGKPRHSSAAREELVRTLTQYSDVCGAPITIVFDGARGRSGTRETASTPDVEILFSCAGQTASQMIERLFHRLRPCGELLVVTDDAVERNRVAGAGGGVANCLDFLQTVERTLAEMEREIELYNQQERLKFNNAA